MKLHLLTGLCGASGAMILSSVAFAAYSHVQVQLYTTVTAGGASRSVYRVYAYFTDPNDYLTAVAGSDLVGNMVIESTTSDGFALDGPFFNPGVGAGGNAVPSAPGASTEWGTYATIGVSYGDQIPIGMFSGSPVIGYSPGFPNFINGNRLDSNNIAWFTSGPHEIGRAGWTGDGDAELRVMMMQLSVNAGGNVRGTVAVYGQNAGDLGTTFSALGQTFTSSVPGPAVLGLGAMAAIAGLKRRTRDAASGDL